MRSIERLLIRAGGLVPGLLGLLALAAAVPGAAQNNPPSRAGFPFTIAGTGTSYGHPAIADLKWGGSFAAYRSIVFTTWDGANARLQVLRYDGANASEAPGFPVDLPPPQVLGSPAVGDLDGDLVPEIVVPYGPISGSGAGGVRAYRRDGTLLWNYPSSNAPPSCCFANFPFGVVGTPAIADLDGDGTVEVVWGSLDAKVYAVEGATGGNKSGWPIFVRDTVWSSPTLFDLDGDGKKEIIIGVDAHAEPPYPTVNGGTLHVFRYDGTGTGLPASIPVPELPGFPVNIDQTVFSAPAVGDIDGDGKPEIVVGTGTYWGNPGPCGSGQGGALRARRVYAFRCDGSTPPGWPVVTDGEVKTAPALADLDGDGVPEVVVTDIDCSTGNPQNYKVYAFRGNGTRIFRTLVRSFFGVNLSAADPVVGDVFGDTKPEILVPSNTEIVAFSATGSQLTHDTGFSPPPATTGLPSFYTPTSLGNATVTSMKVAPTIADLVDVVAISTSGGTATQVNVWNPYVSGTSGAKKTFSEPTWGMFRQGPARTGFVPGTASCVVMAPSPGRFYTLTPCRAVDTRSPAGPYGGPSIAGGTARTFNLASRCGIPSDAKAVSGNAVAAGPSSLGYLVLYPGGTALPSSSTVNYSSGQTRANNVIVRLSGDGNATLVIRNGGLGTTDAVFDVNGYFR